jgi:hypothetical protein
MASTFVVYIHERGKRPRRVGELDTAVIPSTFTVDDRTYVWATADLSARTLTFVDVRPAMVAS